MNQPGEDRTALSAQLAQYALGLHDEIAILARIDGCSQRQQAHVDDADALGVASVERAAASAELHALETRLGPLREQLSGDQARTRRLPDFPVVADLHARARALVEATLARDETTMAALHAANTARREATYALETGGATLAAYRRIIAPTPPNAGLVSERG